MRVFNTLLITALAGILAFFIVRPFYCGANVQAQTASVAQPLVLQQMLAKDRCCFCGEINVGYTFKQPGGLLTTHIAHFDPAAKTLRIEPDPGSGWAFGWANVDEQLIRRVMQEGGQFGLFTRYRPGGGHVPAGRMESF